jgi:hypothetical protein
MRGVVLAPIDSGQVAVFWTDSKFAMNFIRLADVTGNQFGGSFFPTSLGGIFTTPPAVIALTPNRLDVFGLGLDYNVYHKSGMVDTGKGDQWPADWEDLGGNFTCTPVVVSAAANHIDLFGLGSDQSMLHRSYNGSKWSAAWDLLGGGFTSPPVVLPGASGTFDIFGRGLDFLIYRTTWKPGTIAQWSKLGGGLLGEPTSASAPSAVRVRNDMFVFTTADDGAIWYTIFDGNYWKPWASLGVVETAASGYAAGLGGAISFISEPVATFFASTEVNPLQGGTVASGGTGTTRGPPGPYAQPAPLIGEGMRIDVFGVGTYNGFLRGSSLWHKWLDNQGWHGQKDAGGNDTDHWELINGSWACAPSIYAPNHGKTIVSMPPINFYVSEPNTDGTIHFVEFDGANWNAFDKGPAFRLPSLLTFTLDSMEIDNTRSIHNDTDLVATSYTAGKWPIQQNGASPGDVNNGVHDLELQFNAIPVELCEPLVFVYSIVNSGNSDVADTVMDAMQKGGEDYVNDLLKSLANPDNNAIIGGIEVLAEAGGGPTIVGSLLGAAAGILLDKWLSLVYGLIFADCDGTVASESVAFQKARDLQQMIRNKGVNGTYTPPATVHHNLDAPTGCRHSLYKVTWSGIEVQLPLPTD